MSLHPRSKLAARILAVYVAVFGFAAGAITAAASGNSLTVPALSHAIIAKQMAVMPLAFTENKGQWDDAVLFRAGAAGMTIWFTRDGVVYQSLRNLDTESEYQGDIGHHVDQGTDPSVTNVSPVHAEQHVISSNFENANPDPVVTGEEVSKYNCNYFIGNDRSKWRTDVPNYERIVYHDLYPGIDLAFYGNDGKLEYDFIVHLGADPAAISLRYDGVQSTIVDRHGDLVLVTPWGEMSHQVPLVYQLGRDGQKQPLSGGFCVSADGSVRMDIPEEHSPELALVIDPVLSYSTFLGGANEEYAGAIAVDSSGAAYVAGVTTSAAFPVLNAYSGTIAGAADAYVTKLSPSGALVYSTFIGGTDGEYLSGLAIDASGNAYVAGMTFSTDYPMQNPYDATFNGGQTDLYITKLSPAGNALSYSTYFGGTNNDQRPVIAVDAAGAAYVTGKTLSTDLPMQNAFQGTFNGGLYDAFVVKFAPAGNTLAYSTYLGGNDWDYGHAIAVDASGNAYVTGSTVSTNFPTLNAYDNTYNLGVYDVYVTKLAPAGNQLVYSTYLGGSSFDEAFGIAVDASGSAYVTGNTQSPDFPVQNAYDASLSGTPDAFVTKFNPAGNALAFSTYLGGTGDDQGFAIAVDVSNHAYVLGRTNSSDFPMQDPYDNGINGGLDLFVTKLRGNGTGLLYSTYLGGLLDEHPQGYEIVLGIAVDGSGAAYVTGTTPSFDYPTLNAYDGSFNGGNDAFVTRISPGAFDTLQFTAYSPVDIIVINPNHTDSIGPGFNTFGSRATYDSSNDYGIGANGIPGELDDRVNVLQAEAGQWTVKVVPEVGGSGNYFLGVRDPGGNYSGFVSMTGFNENSQSSFSPSPVANPVPPPGSYAITSPLVATVRRGDLNGDNVYNIQDVTLTINIAFRSAAPPDPPSIADVNGDGIASDVLDVVRIIGTAFRNQLEPGP